MSVLAEEFSRGRLICLPLCHRSDDSLKAFLIGVEFHAVHRQENDRRHRTGSFVPVHERMILDDMKEIGRRHIKDVVMQITPAELDSRRRQGGLQKPDVPDVHNSAIPLDLVAVDFDDLIKPKECRIHLSVRQSLQRPAVPPVGLRQGLLERLFALPIPHGGDDKHLPVGGNIERRVVIDLQEIEHASLDHECQTVSMLG